MFKSLLVVTYTYIQYIVLYEETADKERAERMLYSNVKENEILYCSLFTVIPFVPVPVPYETEG